MTSRTAIAQLAIRDVIAFASSTAPAGLPAEIQVLFVPSRNNWNDFGLQVHVDVGFRREHRSFEWVHGLLAIQGHSSTSQYLEGELRKRRRAWMPLSAIDTPIASMLRGEKSYTLMRSVLGREQFRAYARGASDYVEAIAREESLPGWEDFSSAEVFRHAFLRTSENAFVVKHAREIFEGSVASVVDARQSFTAHVKLGSTSVAFDFTFPEAGIAPHRLAVIIGRNGAGKTASLRAIGKRLIDSRSRGARFTPEPSFNRLLIFAHSRTLGRFKAASNRSTSGTQQLFPLDPRTRFEGNRRLTEQFVSGARTTSQTGASLRNLDAMISAELGGLTIAVPVRDSDTVTAPGAAGRFLPLRHFSKGGERARLDLLASVDVSRPLKAIDTNGAQRRLSIGQDIFLTFVLQVFAEIGPGSIVLVDEPENYLHPSLVSQFIRVLYQLLHNNKSIAIVATHSPYVVREVPTSQVFVLASTGPEYMPAVERPRLPTFGASVSAISDFVFGDSLRDHLFTRVLKDFAASSIGGGELPLSIQNELGLDALLLLRAEQRSLSKE